jgi:hypothetical protein
MKRAANPSSRTTASAAIARNEAARGMDPIPQRADVTITGEAKSWRVAGDSGNEKVHAFCPTCGTPVYLTFVAMPDLIAVHATSLDDPSQFNPQMVTYSIRGHAWDTIDSSLQKFERMPRG